MTCSDTDVCQVSVCYKCVPGLGFLVCVECVHLYVCVHTCLHAFVHVCVYVCVCVHACVCCLALGFHSSEEDGMI